MNGFLSNVLAKKNRHLTSGVSLLFKKTSKLFCLLACLWMAGGLLQPLHAQSAPPSDEFEMLMEKIRQDFVSNPDIEKSLAKYNEKDGSFADVDYASEQRTNWPPLAHVDRISRFVFAYTNPANRHYREADLYDKIVKGLEYWHARNPHCNNWWYNQIAEPQKLGVLLIQMRVGEKQLPAELEAKILERIRQDGGNPAKWTGANRTDIALHWIYRSCLSRNAEDLAFAMDNVYNPVVYTTGEGFQFDNSNFQHGTQLYIGGYGDEILKGVTQVAMYARGTRFAMPSEKIDLISKFMRETYYATIRGKYMLFDVMGRSMSRPGVPDKSATALFAKRMLLLDPAHADEFQAIIDRLEGTQPAGYALTGRHTHYFRGDYTLHVRPTYTFDVRMVSTRTCRCEYGNGENLKTYFLSDGCTNVVRRGDEYEGIFPVWNWTRIPGVTAPQVKEIPMAASDWQTRGTSTFAGGVSDSLYGVSAYAYMDTFQGMNVGGHKAWFFFDDEVVCLGAGISSATAEPVYTTVNQCIAHPEGALVSARGRQTGIPEVETKYENPDWVWHDGVGYFFPKGGQVVAAVQKQTGTWYDINHSINRKEPVEKNVFTLCVDHGTQPRDGSYAYIVLPGKTVQEMENYRSRPHVEILSNTADVQAVCNRKLDVWQIVFYRPGTFRNGDLTVEADKPCALMLKQVSGGHAQLHIADPGQTGQPIQLQITLPGKEQQTVVHRPGSDPVYAGASHAYNL